MLRSPYLANIDELRIVASGGAALHAGKRSVGVAQVQAALSDLGYALPRSNGGGHALDGMFGTETAEALRAFQRDSALPQTGVAEARTLAALDHSLAIQHPVAPKFKGRRGRNAGMKTNAKPVGRGAKPLAAPSERPLGFWGEHYEVGTADPRLSPDPGAGGWNSKPKTYSAMEQAIAIKNGLMAASGVVGPNAARHLGHYSAITAAT